MESIKEEITHDIINEQLVSAEYRLGTCRYPLGRGNYYYTISEMSALGISTVCEIVSEVMKHLCSKFIPTTEEEFKSKILEVDEM